MMVNLIKAGEKYYEEKETSKISIMNISELVKYLKFENLDKELIWIFDAEYGEWYPLDIEDKKNVKICKDDPNKELE